MLEIVKKDIENQDVFQKLDILVQRAIKYSMHDGGAYKSCHEGISILLAEIEYAEEITKGIKKLHLGAWEGVKNEDYTSQLPPISKLYANALLLASQAVKITAAAEQYYKYLEENNPQMDLETMMSTTLSTTPRETKLTDEMIVKK